MVNHHFKDIHVLKQNTEMYMDLLNWAWWTVKKDGFYF